MYALPLGAQTQLQSQVAQDLRLLSLDDLAKITVTSVSRGEQPLSSAPAAITVVTNEDIRRSGVTTLPEALRGVPGIHVARETSNTWAVSARGFSSPNSEKLLVLSDTRSLYTPLYSGVFWDVQDYLLEDIDRIEVIRGPGAALWGSNAVNGVINITTKSAKDTQGLYADTSVGNEDQFAAKARYGGRIGNDAHYRVYGKYVGHDDSIGPPGSIQRDDWKVGHGGFRADWNTEAINSFTIQGDVYKVDAGRLVPSASIMGRPGPQGVLRTVSSGGNALARWRHRPSDASDLQVRVYYDRTHRDDPNFVDDLDTFDADVQHRRVLQRRHEITWGANYRFTSNRNEPRVIFALEPTDSEDQVFSGFVQDQIRLTDSLHLTAGTKIEHNDFSGGEVQPSGRVAWQPSPRQTLWGAVSRAVRVPTRLERDIAIDINPSNDPAATLFRLLGNPDFGSEELLAYEAGYRWQPLSRLTLDVAAFHNRYDGLASLEQGAPFTRESDGRRILPILNQNLTDGDATGFEASVTTTPVDWWRLSASSSTVNINLDAGGTDVNFGRLLEEATPRHQLGIRSAMDIGTDLQVDAFFRHSTEITRTPILRTGPPIPAYAELDLRLSWSRWNPIELSLVGQNLLHDQHVEFGAPDSRGQIERAVYARITWRP
jgi:iron complex outermembrane receptor protein